jgi:CarD family transcriptional regulator
VTISAPATMAGRQATKEDIISGAVEESLLEDDLDPDAELEAELDPDADGEFDAVADLDADVALDADVDADDSVLDVEVTVAVEHIEFELGDNVVYPHHGAGQVQAKEIKEVFGVRREYLTIKILHNDMTVMVPTENAALAGLRRVIDEETVEKVLNVLRDDVSDMPKNWNRRFKHNRDKIKTGDIYELAEVVRNLALRESEKGLSSGEKQMYTRAKKILASELMYALDKDEDEAEAYLDGLLSRSPDVDAVARGR